MNKAKKTFKEINFSVCDLSKSYRHSLICFNDKSVFDTFLMSFKYKLFNCVLKHSENLLFVNKGFVKKINSLNEAQLLVNTLDEISLDYLLNSKLELKNILDILSGALYERLRVIGSFKVVIGLSGGLDSVFSLCVLNYTFSKFKLDSKNIFVISMPYIHSLPENTERSKSLALKFNNSFEVKDISVIVKSVLEQFNHTKKDVSYENVQARARSLILFTKANLENALLIGTGDLSENFLGWNTFGADQISMFNLIGGLYKSTLFSSLKFLDAFFPKIKEELQSLASLPVSPELNDNHDTESIVGKYVYNDFFIYLLYKRIYSKKEMLTLFKNKFSFDGTEIFNNLLKRFKRSGFKRYASAESIAVFDYPLDSLKIPGDLEA